MAPRRGGSSSSSSYSSSCPGAFETTDSRVYLACIVIFFVVYLGIALSLSGARKKAGTGKRLIGAPYIVALLFMLIAYALDIASTVLVECETLAGSSYYSIAIAMTVFYYLAYWTLLFVVVYMLNTTLRDHTIVIIKIVLLAIVGIVFAITAAHIGVSSWNLWAVTDAGYWSNSRLIIRSAKELRVAWSVLYLLAVLAAGVLALMSSRQYGSKLLIWVSAVIFSMALWSIIAIVFAASNLTDGYPTMTFETSAALTYVQSFFQALSFILIMCIAKRGTWSKPTIPAANTTPYTQNHHAYAHAAGPQQPSYK